MTAFSGNIYGVVLNDRDERATLESSFHAAPYGKPPVAPVVFMKPRTCLQGWSSPADANDIYRASTSLALLFARDATMVSADQAQNCVGATALAIDLSLLQPNYYRPAVAFRNSDGTLILGNWSAPVYPKSIELLIDGRMAHSWDLSRLVRPIPALVSDISQFLTLKAGDVLLVGFAGDAPNARIGQSIAAQTQNLARASSIIGGTQA
jgi:5-oxopent-3-ene-1,2,5-tricarboxylate decarboxylase / 2-hydroxyhepta-2,4-diene-1,7-dioate isomerase